MLGEFSIAGNMVLSPFAVTQAIAMVASGASGETLKEFQDVFTQGSGDGWLRDWSFILNQQVVDPDLKVFKTRSKLFGHTGYLFLTDYLDNLAGYFQTRFAALDFTGLGYGFQAEIDNWIERTTNGRIEYIETFTDPAKTRLILAQTTRFNAKWDAPFKSGKNFTGWFQKLDGQLYLVPMVQLRGAFNHYKDDTVSVVELPLTGNKYSLIVFMPEQNYYQFKDSFLDNFQRLVDLLAPQSMVVKLPVFAINSNNLSTVEFLKSNGVTRAFDKYAADFSGVNSMGYTFVKDFRQSAMIDLSTRGMHGAAAAAAANEATPDEPPSVWSDSMFTMANRPFIAWPPPEPPDARPFIFVVRDTQTKAILFIGSLVDPEDTPVN